MEPVLIYTDQQKINEVKSMRDNHLDYLRDFYSELDAIDINVTVQQLISLAQFGWNIEIHHQEKKIFAFVQNQLLEKAGTPDFNGVPISKTKLKELIDMPNLDGLYSLLQVYYQYQRTGYSMIPECFAIGETGVEKSEQSDTVIEDMYTYYTKNDAGVFIMGKIGALCDALNQYNNVVKIAGVSDSGYRTELAGLSGIDFNGNINSFVANLKFVRDYEDSHPSFVLEEE